MAIAPLELDAPAPAAVPVPDPELRAVDEAGFAEVAAGEVGLAAAVVIINGTHRQR